MARDYIRPEIPDRLYTELTQDRRLLINPEKADLLLALEATQHGSRERLLTAPRVLRGWRRLQAGDTDPVALAAQTEAPDHYQWPMRVTVFQAVVITSKLIGAVFERARIEPGQPLQWPIPPSADSTRDRRNAIVTTFWMHLSDDDIRQLDQYTAAA